MKTLKWVRRAIILDGTYCLFAVLVFIGMKIDHGILGVIGVLSFMFCLLNPCGLLTLIFGMIAYFQDLRRDAHSKELIGYKWLVFPVGFIATLIMLCENAVVFVRATGGA